MIALLIAFLVSLMITLLIVKYEHLHSHITADHDLDGVQKFHAEPVPRVGGIGILVGLLCGEFAKFAQEPGIASLGLWVIVSALPALIVGLIEDLTKRVSVTQRLLATAISAVLGGLLVGGWLVRLDIPGLDYLLTFTAISVLITAFSVAGVAHAFNLIDGYNGLSGMVAVIVLCGLAYVASQVGDRAITVAAFATAGGILGFLIWNYPRGLIFLGDGGAYLIGFLVAELSVLLIARNPAVSPWCPLILAFYPIFETVFTIFRRMVIAKTNPGLPDAEHLHHHIYNRIVRWALGADYEKQKYHLNSMTSPFLWIVALTGVIPGIIFWNNTVALQLAGVFICFAYISVYAGIARGR